MLCRPTRRPEPAPDRMVRSGLHPEAAAMKRGSQPTCRYGVLAHRCGARATTTRLRPSQSESWPVCDFHALVLDRMRANMAEHADLLDALARW